MSQSVSRCGSAQLAPVPTTPSPQVCVQTLPGQVHPWATWQSTQPGLVASPGSTTPSPHIDSGPRSGTTTSLAHAAAAIQDTSAATSTGRGIKVDLDTYRPAPLPARPLSLDTPPPPPAQRGHAMRTIWNGRREQGAQRGTP